MRLSVESIWQDARYAVRGMRKRPGFTSLAVVTLALGIGVNAASLAVAYGILVRPLPYVEPSRVIILNLLFADGGDLGFSPDVLQEWLPRLRTVDVAAGYYRREVTVRSGNRSTVIPAAVVTDRFFEVLGTRAEVGHTRMHIDSPEVVVGRRAIDEILGNTASEPAGVLLSVSEKGHSIGGVLPSDFAFPDDEIGLWLPSTVLRAGTKSEYSGYSKIIARLKPGVTVEQFRDDANRVLLELNPKSREMVSVAVLGESVVGGMRRLLIATLVGALLVLIVACANVATLFIGREVSRQREMAARMALGASGSQLVRSVLVETLLIALIASLVGMGLGAATLKIFVVHASGVITGLHRVAIGLPIAIATAGLTVLVTLLCGAVPAWHAARIDFRPFLRATMGLRPRAWHVRRTLVIAQIALSCVLLVGAGLLARTVSVLMREDHGFQAGGALEAKVVLSDRVLFDGTGRETFVRDLLERVRAMPGVQHAGFGTNLPPRTPPITIAIRLAADGRLSGPIRDETRFMKVGSGTPGYLRALGARFVAGRDFEEGDDRPETPAVILSESVARFYFRDEDPIGRTIARLPAMFGMTGNPRVIGVVRDIKYEGIDSPAGSAIYLPWARRPLGSGYLIVRAGDDPMRLAVAIRRAAQDLDPTVPVPELQSLEQAIAQSIANRRVRALPAIGFGVLALSVAFVGVLATLLTLVAERRRDLAIRSALGAPPGHLVWTIVAQGLALTSLGLTIGLGVAGAAGTALSSLLYGVSPFDATTFAGTALLIGGGALLTTYLAALRTRGVNPLVVLRHE
jgi:putative ABC transport system permease protein